VALQTTFIFAAILLHGVCYDFLFIAGQLYVDNEANERMRGKSSGGTTCGWERMPRNT